MFISVFSIFFTHGFHLCNHNCELKHPKSRGKDLLDFLCSLYDGLLKYNTKPNIDQYIGTK